MPSPVLIPPVFPEPFAVEWGQDEYGIFMGFAVEHIVQRMRWIPPGTFLMGSPESEVGRIHDEVQHRVELTQGFWLGDTQVTQALWEAVMGETSSQFKGPNNPVESVSWEDCQEFIGRLNERVEGLGTRLPREAEWEYACRAGTTTATWVGDFQLAHRTSAPQLDLIAWYVGNAGGTTHPVAQKAANPWGLYDVLGNVYEWCADWFAPYDVNVVSDPSGPITAAYRILRGGSWNSYATSVRAGNRNANLSDYRYDLVGLRLARSARPR